MERKYKKGDKVKLLFNGGIGTRTCYDAGDLLTVVKYGDSQNINVKSESRNTVQCVFAPQIELYQKVMPKPEDYITITLDGTPIQLIKVKQIHPKTNGTFLYTNIEGHHIHLIENVFYQDNVATFDFNNGIHDFDIMNNQDKHWLDWCIVADKFVPNNEVPYIGDCILIRPTATTTITGKLLLLNGQSVHTNLLHYKGDAPKAHSTIEIFSVKLSNIKKISQENVYSIHNDTVAASFRKEIKPEPIPELEFPNLGWCPDGDKYLGDYLAIKNDCPYISPGDAGYAWNSNSYWKIDIASGKPSWTLDYLKKIINQKEYVDTAIIEEIPMTYVKGDILYIIAKKHGHRFNIDEKVQIIGVTKYGYDCKSLERNKSGWVATDECEKRECDASGKTKNVIGMQRDYPAVSIPMIVGTGRELDKGIYPPAYGNGPAWMQDLHLIVDHTSSVTSDEDIPKDSVFIRMKKLLHLDVKAEITIKDRVVKPIEVKSKIKNIDKGLIVPLEPIKDRIIK